MNTVDDMVVCLGELSQHVSRHIDGVHGRNGIGQRNFEECHKNLSWR